MLDEKRDHAGIGPTAGDGSRRARGARLLGGQRHFAKGVVGARFRALRRIEIEAEPGLVDGVDIKSAKFVAELHDVGRAGIDRKIDAKTLAAAFSEQRCKQLAIIVPRHALLDKAYIVLLAMRLAALVL